MIIKTTLILAMLSTIYSILGVEIEAHHLITRPAHWSLYGAFFGVLGGFVAGCSITNVNKQ